MSETGAMSETIQDAPMVNGIDVDALKGAVGEIEDEHDEAGFVAEAVAELAQRLESAGHGCRVLAVPRPFHTPLMQ